MHLPCAHPHIHCPCDVSKNVHSGCHSKQLVGHDHKFARLVLLHMVQKDPRTCARTKYRLLSILGFNYEMRGYLRSIHVAPETTRAAISMNPGSTGRTNTTLAKNFLDLRKALVGMLEDLEHHARRYLVSSSGDSHLELRALFVQS